MVGCSSTKESAPKKEPPSTATIDTYSTTKLKDLNFGSSVDAVKALPNFEYKEILKDTSGFFPPDHQSIIFKGKERSFHNIPLSYDRPYIMKFTKDRLYHLSVVFLIKNETDRIKQYNKLKYILISKFGKEYSSHEEQNYSFHIWKIGDTTLTLDGMHLDEKSSLALSAENQTLWDEHIADFAKYEKIRNNAAISL